MYRRILTLLALATLPAAALAAPEDQPATAERDQAGTSESTPRPQVQRGADPDQVRPESEAATGAQSGPNLMATDELIGRDVVTQEGERIGTLQFVTVSLDQGTISHLIVDTSGTDFAPQSGAQQNAGERGATSQQPMPADDGSSTQAGGAGQTDATAQARATEQSDAAAQSGQTATAQAGGTQDGEQQNGNLLIVPWSVATVDAAASGIVVAATGRHINNAPRLQREELNRLTEPAVASYVIDYWAPASELAALEGRRQPSRSEQQPGSQGSQSDGVEKNHQGRNDTTRSKEQSPRGPSPDQAGVEKQSQPSRPEQALTERSESAPVGRLSQSEAPAAAKSKQGQTAGPDQQGQQTADTAQSGATQPGTAQADATQQRGPARPNPGQQGPVTTESGQVVLVGQEVVAAVTPPMFQLGKQLRGAQVVDESGNDIGEIRQIMIDTRTGDAAFAILEGTSPGRAPVPLQSLTWSAEGTTMLTSQTSNLRSNPTLTERPSEATRQDLAQLYQRFGAEPYWDRGGRSASGRTPTPQGSSEQVPQ